jgi:hypothetical protein
VYGGMEGAVKGEDDEEYNPDDVGCAARSLLWAAALLPCSRGSVLTALVATCRAATTPTGCRKATTGGLWAAQPC